MQRKEVSRKRLAIAFFIMKNAGEDFDLIGLLALGRKPALAGAALIEKLLDVGFFKRDQRRSAIDGAADRYPMAFTKGRYAK